MITVVATRPRFLQTQTCTVWRSEDGLKGTWMDMKSHSWSSAPPSKRQRGRGVKAWGSSSKSQEENEKQFAVRKERLDKGRTHQWEEENSEEESWEDWVGGDWF